MNAPNSRNTQKPRPVRRPRTQLVHEVCRNRLAIYEVFRADQKAEDEANLAGFAAKNLLPIEDPDPAAEETTSTDQVPAEEITE